MIFALIYVVKLQPGFDPICQILRPHERPIARTTQRTFMRWPRAARAASDERLVPIVKTVRQDSFGVYGVRKQWHALRRKGEKSGCGKVARHVRVAT